MNQAEIIKRLSDKEVKKLLFLTQGLFFILSIFASLFLFERSSDWIHYIDFRFGDILLYGLLPAVILVGAEMILYLYVPEKALDDGGINEKVFKNQKVSTISTISFIVAVCEEMLFRGVIQVSFGYLFASSLFAIIHVRYLKKPLLLGLIIVTSFLIGYLFVLTENLLVTIVFHFTVDFLLGLFIKYKSEVQ